MANLECVDTDEIFDALRPMEKMRLYFLLLSLRDIQAEQALIVAEQMERFITAGRQVPDSPVAKGEDRATAPPSSEKERDHPGANVCLDQDQGVRGYGRSEKGVLSNKEFRSQFISAICAGTNNKQLAERFGLTLRQVNGLRMGLAKRKIGPFADGAPSSFDGTADQQREELPRPGDMSQEIIDDIVRFLRQRGDIVVRSGENFLIDNRHTLTMRQLLERANRKRRELGKSEFSMSAVNGGTSPSILADELGQPDANGASLQTIG